MDVMFKDDSAEFGKKLIKLYGLKIFPRMGKVFADMLFQTGVEAGALLSSLEDVFDYGTRATIATQATVKLNQIAYTLGIMKEAGYYTADDVKELEESLEDLVQNVRPLLTPGFSMPYHM